MEVFAILALVALAVAAAWFAHVQKKKRQEANELEISLRALVGSSSAGAEYL